jgi:hypothetical protein
VFYNTAVPRAVLSVDVTSIYWFFGSIEGEVCASPPAIKFRQFKLMRRLVSLSCISSVCV